MKGRFFHPRYTGAWLAAGGALFVAWFAALSWLSPPFAPDSPTPVGSVLLTVAVTVLLGGLYLGATRIIREPVRLPLAPILLVGLLARLVLIPSYPILENDVYRYLWDGAMVANGLNPYAVAPAEVLDPPSPERERPPRLTALAEEAGPVLEHINHPSLRTIYPVTAQAVFALAYWVAPWCTAGWRVVLLAFDVGAAALALVLLRNARRPATWVGFYWLNPVLIRETYNTCHVDIVLVPLLLAVLLLFAHQRYGWAASALAVATGVKVWPVLLLPLVLRPLLGLPRKLAFSLVSYAALVGLMVIPVYLGGVDEGSGFVAYSRFWEMNDAAFMIVLWVVEAVWGWVGSGPVDAQTVARWFVAGCIGLLVLLLSRRPARDADDLARRGLLITTALFVLSPTQFPWYYTWLLPFLVLRPRTSLFAYAVMLPLYYLRFWFKEYDQLGWFDFGIVWLEHVPVVLLFLWEELRGTGAEVEPPGPERE